MCKCFEYLGKFASEMGWPQTSHLFAKGSTQITDVRVSSVVLLTRILQDNYQMKLSNDDYKGQSAAKSSDFGMFKPRSDDWMNLGAMNKLYYGLYREYGLTWLEGRFLFGHMQSIPSCASRRMCGYVWYQPHLGRRISSWGWLFFVHPVMNMVNYPSSIAQAAHPSGCHGI